MSLFRPVAGQAALASRQWPIDRRLIAVIVVAAVLLFGGCSGSSDDEQGTASSLGAVVTGAEATTESTEETPPPSLGHVATEAAPSVVVAHATGPSIVAFSEPDRESPPITELQNPTVAGGPLAFQVVDTELTDAELLDGAEWLEVHLPIRPNGSTGWVDRSAVELSRNPFRIEISTAEHRLEVFRSGQRWISTTVAIGTGETPTPLGHFYIIELLQPPTADGPYGSFAFGLSGFSETLTSFAGGDGVVGIHGTNDPDSLGSDVSHGCVRVANDVIESLAGTIPLGTPVIIRA